METTQHFETKPVLCRARSKMNDEELYFVSEAELLARLAENARRLKIVQSFLQNYPAENLLHAWFFISAEDIFYTDSLSFLYRRPWCYPRVTSCERLLGSASASFVNQE